MTVARAVRTGYRELLLLPRTEDVEVDADGDGSDAEFAREAEEVIVHLLSHVLNLDWETGYRDLREVLICQRRGGPSELASRAITSEESRQFSELLDRRKRHEPLQYLVGKWDFMDFTFEIRPPLLCPRPETEELVQLVYDDIVAQARQKQREGGDRAWKILDVGCGTGCIGIALAHMLNVRANVRARVDAIDVEPVAVDTSLENARSILGGDWRETYSAQLVSARDFRVGGDADGYDVVVSNPPYVLPGDLDSLPPNVRDYESLRALCGGDSPDGMDVIRTVVDRLPEWCRTGDETNNDSSEDNGEKNNDAYAYCWMEVDPTQPELLKEWLPGEGEGEDKVEFVAMHKDFCDRDRFVQLRVHRSPGGGRPGLLCRSH